MDTEVFLLELLIKAECVTKAAFAKRIGMSRQNINYLIRNAELNDGHLSESFKRILREHDLDLYRFKRSPTSDFIQNDHLGSGVEAYQNTDSEMQKEIIALLKREIELMKRVSELEKQVDQLTSGVSGKKQSSRRSA